MDGKRGNAVRGAPEGVEITQGVREEDAAFQIPNSEINRIGRLKCGIAQRAAAAEVAKRLGGVGQTSKSTA